MYLYGGCNLTPTGDLFVLDLCQWKWSEIVVDEAAPLQRFSHQLNISDDSHVYLFGAVDELGADCQTLHTADLSTVEEGNLTCRWKSWTSFKGFGSEISSLTYHKVMSVSWH